MSDTYDTYGVYIRRNKEKIATTRGMMPLTEDIETAKAEASRIAEALQQREWLLIMMPSQIVDNAGVSKKRRAEPLEEMLLEYSSAALRDLDRENFLRYMESQGGSQICLPSQYGDDPENAESQVYTLLIRLDPQFDILIPAPFFSPGDPSRPTFIIRKY